MLSAPLPVREPPTKPKRLAATEIGEKATSMFSADKAIAARAALSLQLGVSVPALEALAVGYGVDWNGDEFTSWPSRNADGAIIGIVRRYRDGAKKTYRGTSNAGVFVAPEWWKPKGELLIVEGGSDTAACIDAGHAVIGRPSCTGGAQIVAAMIRHRARRKRVVVFGENDRKEKCPVNCDSHCLACWPGLHGARKVAKTLTRLLRRSVGVQMPRGKDIREDLTCRTTTS